MRTHAFHWLALLVVPGLLMFGCSNVDADRVNELETELAEVRADLQTDRDRLAELEQQQEGIADRRANSLATQARVAALIDDPAAFGTEDEVLDLLVELATPDAEMEDTAFGTVDMRTAWRNTMFRGVDATIVTWQTWMSEDGSTGGSLWSWDGTAANGRPFRLIGINLSTYDDDGLIEHSLVDWPYPAEEVATAFSTGN